MTVQASSLIFQILGATLALLAVLLFWLLSRRTVTAETAIHSGPGFLRRIARNSLVPLIAIVIVRGLMWAFAAYYIRVIGLEEYGYYAIAVNVIGYFGPVTDFGLGILLTRDVSRRPHDAATYTALVQRIRLLLSVAALPIVLLIMLSYWFGGKVETNTVVTGGLLALALIPANVAGTASSLFAARERMDYTALVQVATALLTVGLGMAAIALGWGYVGLAITALIANVVTAFVLLRSLPREATATRSWDGGVARSLMVASFPLMISVLLSLLFFRVDLVVLSIVRDTQEVGAYAAAYKYIEGFALLPSTLVLALFPALSRVAETDRAALQEILNKALQLMLVIAIGSTICFFVFAESFIWLLAGDRTQALAVTALAILVLFLPFNYINAITQYVLIALDRQKLIAFTFVFATSFNLITNIIFIPQYGATAAAVTTVVSELILLAPLLVIARRDSISIPILTAGWRPLLAGGGMLAVIWLTGALPALPSIALAGAVYVGLAIALGAVPREDLGRFWNAMRRAEA